MKIVIVGDGKMGFYLAGRLSKEGHDVVVIDEKESALKASSDTQDVSCILGSGVDYDVLVEANVSSCDVLIAVTSTDELNIICALLAKKLGAAKTIARVRSPEYLKSLDKLKDEINLSLSVNPERLAANEIARILRFPIATKIDYFAKERVEMVEFVVQEKCSLIGRSLQDLPNGLKVKILICAVQKSDGEVIIPSGNYKIDLGDRLTVTGRPNDIVKFFEQVKIPNETAKSVLIVGGGRIGYYLAGELAELGVKVKIIERNKEKCDRLADELDSAMIICGDGSDQEVLLEEGVANVDAFIGLTGFDEENVVMSMFALSQGAKKVIPKINHINFGGVLTKAGIDCVISPHVIAANNIVLYIKAMQNTSGGNMEGLTKLAGGGAEAIEFKIGDKFEGLNIPLKDLKLENNLLIAGIIREGALIFPSGQDKIAAGDNIIVVTTIPGIDEPNGILM